MGGLGGIGGTGMFMGRITMENGNWEMVRGIVSEMGYGYIQITEIPSHGRLFAFGRSQMSLGGSFSIMHSFEIVDCDHDATERRDETPEE